MKVLWVEDDPAVCDWLNIVADKSARNRVQVDLVVASSLMDAETRLRLERFDLVVLDLALPDSFDADMTIARVANMGAHRIGVVSDLEAAAEIVEVAANCNCNISPKPVDTKDVPFNRFIQRPETFFDFLLDFMPVEAAAADTRAA